MRIGSVCALGLLCLIGAAASAEDKQTPAKPDKKICRREEVVGSIIPAHICMTRAEWDQLAAHYEEQDKSFLTRRSEAHGAGKVNGGQ